MTSLFQSLFADGQTLEDVLSESLGSVIERERLTLELLLSEHGRRVVLFGAGGTGRRTLACLRSIGIEPLAISDNNSRLWGTAIDGASVLAPADAALRYGRRALFIVTIWNAAQWFTDTLRQLNTLGCEHVIPVSPVYWRFPETFLPFFCQDLPHKIHGQREEIVRANEIWADDQSRSEYVAHVRWRIRGDFAGLPTRPTEESYFPECGFELSPDEAFVDCGAFDGDTIRRFIARQGDRFRRIDAIEADRTTFSRLEAYTAGLPPTTRDKIALHCCAVGATRGTVAFDESASHVSEHGGSMIDEFPLDELCGDVNPTYVKMDIEGAEREALLGARRIIEERRPVLAVCVYHKPDDLWRLPLLIHDRAPDYRMYLRTYEGDGWQTVAYAVPADRVRTR